MIVRACDSHLLLVTQPEHARLAGTLMAAWQADGLPAATRRNAILLATRAHDDGWEEEDRLPIVDLASGAILNFGNAPASVKQGVWRRSVMRLSGTPYSAALVAQHALSVYRSNRPDPEWAAFFTHIEEVRDSMLASCEALTLADLTRDYFFIRAGDLMSLIFCHAWTKPEQLDQYELRFDGSCLHVTPDPFAGRTIEFTVTARRMAKGPFTAAAAARVFRSARLQRLAGVASGP